MSGGVFIIPFRQRDEHLAKFVSHYGECIPELPIVVVEQHDDKAFNRAKLLNVGFLETPGYDYYIFHDVDMWIDLNRSDPYEAYAFPKNVVHAATHLQQFGFNEAYPEFFGGINIFSVKDFLKADGFSNLIYSYGHEDDEMRDRILSLDMPIERRNTYYQCGPHKRNIDPVLFHESLAIRKAGRNPEIDGLSHCKYTVISREEKPGYTLIKADL